MGIIHCMVEPAAATLCPFVGEPKEGAKSNGRRVPTHSRCDSTPSSIRIFVANLGLTPESIVAEHTFEHETFFAGHSSLRIRLFPALFLSKVSPKRSLTLH